MENFQPHVNREEIIKLIRKNQWKYKDGTSVSHLYAPNSTTPYAVVECRGVMNWVVFHGDDYSRKKEVGCLGAAAEYIGKIWW